jgi:hypothetical protein
LTKEFDRQTIPAKVNALMAIVNHKPTGYIGNGFDLHTKLRISLRIAFGETIQTSDLADLLFLCNLDGYQFQTDSYKTKGKFVFDEFQSAVETAYDSKSSSNSNGPQANQAVAGCKDHGSKWLFQKICYRCHPCNKCETAKLPYTWH